VTLRVFISTDDFDDERVQLLSAALNSRGLDVVDDAPDVSVGQRHGLLYAKAADVDDVLLDDDVDKAADEVRVLALQARVRRQLTEVLSSSTGDLHHDAAAMQEALDVVTKVFPAAQASSASVVETELNDRHIHQIDVDHGIDIDAYGRRGMLYSLKSCLEFIGDDTFSGDTKDMGHVLTDFVGAVSPTSVRDLHRLLKDGVWRWAPETWPSFGGNAPDDVDEVVAWDTTHILTGTCVENVVVMTRAAWDNFCEHEHDWAKAD